MFEVLLFTVGTLKSTVAIYYCFNIRFFVTVPPRPNWCTCFANVCTCFILGHIFKRCGILFMCVFWRWIWFTCKLTVVCSIVSPQNSLKQTVFCASLGRKCPFIQWEQMMASVLITLPLGCSEGVAALILLPPADCTDLLPVVKMLLFAEHRCGVDMCGAHCIVIQVLESRCCVLWNPCCTALCGQLRLPNDSCLCRSS